MDEHRLPFKAYRMLFDLDVKGKKNWVTQIRTCLYEHGFGYVWLNQGVENLKQFINIFRQRLVDCHWQRWNYHVQNSNRFNMYRQFIGSHDVKPYLKLDIDVHVKRIMAKFRLGVSDVNVHKFRYRAHSNNDLTCPLCNESIEDEVHFVLCCPAFDHIRQKYIPAKYTNQPNLFRLSLLLASSYPDVRNLAVYLCKAFKIRDVMIS